MQSIAKFKKCELFQDGEGYIVMSHNNICVFASASIVAAYKHAEWFDGK